MRRRRRQNVQPGVSLFPFLAVLICTLGVLIVLLVLAAKSATIAQAQQETAIVNEAADQAAQKAAAELEKRNKQQAIVARLEDQIDRHI